MRKFLNFKRIAASILVVSISFASCQKDQDVADEANSASSANDEMKISSQAVNNTNIRGLISKETAERMGETFNQTYKTANSTQYVAFDIKDMSNYLQELKAKYKSDSVYVSFGVYDAKTAVKTEDIGRITVFFMGKNNNKTTGNIRSQASDDNEASNYFNHGSIWP